MKPEQMPCRSRALELQFWLSQPCCRVRPWQRVAEGEVTAAATEAAAMEVAVMEVAVTAISEEVMGAAISAAGATAAAISAVVTTAARGSPSHIHFHEAAPVTAG
jgi:hypothetical protein